MILNELFESRMSELDVEYQDWLHSRGRGAIGDKEFERAYGMTRREWAIRNRNWIYKKQQLPQDPDSYLYPERQGYRPVKKETVHEDSDLHILYLDGRPVARFPNLEDAEEQARDIMQKYPGTEVTLQRQICKLTPVELKENLRKWFKEKWVRFGPDGKIRGACARGSKSEGKPKCLPQAKAHALGKKGRASAAAKKRREDPNPERRGPAKNVATKVQEAAGLYGPFTLTINTGERPTSRTKTKKFKREDDAILWAEDWFEDFPQYVYATAEITDPEGNVIWYSDETMVSGQSVSKDQIDEKQDACYNKVKSRYKVWPSAYASGALVQCRKKGAANWGTGGKKKK